mgnify:CR=1 FL=1
MRKSDELKEMAEKAEEIEELLSETEYVRSMVQEWISNLSTVNIDEPYGYASSIADDALDELEEKLERLR